MKQLYEADKQVSAENVIIKMEDREDANIHSFRVKHGVPKIEASEVFDM
jgi:hypothetical protein